ncbi:MAG: FAD-binding oxidoreductase [Rhodocyclaceae bacterium]|nr:FAD-binding oxidoreductase [Rhodocyclaceae bacterium]
MSNLTGLFQTPINTYSPSSFGEVLEIVRTAHISKQTLYPFSTGLNLGYGSRSPVISGCSLVDLSKMNRILNADKISLNNPIAVIEPGVTQAQLADFLTKNCPQLTFNVTGAGRDTSILGNALDRGVGYFGPRKDDVFGLEIVMGTGEVIQTGFRRLGEQSPLAHCHPYGLGPIIDGIFFQGNFGIVTSACFRLIPRRPKEVAVSMALRDVSHLADFIDELARLKRDGLLTSVTHIGNKARTQSTLAYGVTRYLETECGYTPEKALAEADRAISIVAPDEWASLAAVTGNAGQVRAAIREIKQRISRYARVMVITETLLDVGYAVTHALRFIPFARANAAAIHSIRPLHALALGIPTDVAIDNLLWKYGRSDLPAKALDESNCGLLFVNPALPLDGKAVVKVIDELEIVAASHQHKLYMTLNIETPTSMVAVINLLFDRSQPEEVERAHRCADDMLACIRRHGLEPYRARADMMKDIVQDNEYWRTIRKLKDVFDPDNIIAPGRYNLAD